MLTRSSTPVTSNKSKGFTLIELLVVISIIALLASVVLASLSGVRSKARDSSRIQGIIQLRNALELYRTKNGIYPNDLAALVTDNDISKIPSVTTGQPTYFSDQTDYILYDNSMENDVQNGGLKYAPNSKVALVGTPNAIAKASADTAPWIVSQPIVAGSIGINSLSITGYTTNDQGDPTGVIISWTTTNETSCTFSGNYIGDNNGNESWTDYRGTDANNFFASHRASGTYIANMGIANETNVTAADVTLSCTDGKSMSASWP